MKDYTVDIDIKKYRTMTKIELENGNNLVLYSSFYSEDEKYPEIFGKEIFLIDKNDNIIWQIDDPIGVDSVFDGNIGDSVTKPCMWNFSGFIKRDGKVLAVKFDGSVYEMDMKTGKTTYLYWTK